MLKLGMRSIRIPISGNAITPLVNEEYILVSPTYAGDDGRGAVPKQVIRFLNERDNRELLAGVIASGNRNFGKYFGHAGKVISEKCNVPFLYKFELMGTPDDVKIVRDGVLRFWAARENESSTKLVVGA
jgi:protein involved in ribonucleotide reduction